MATSKLPDDFAVFILTHGRPDNVITYKTLQRCGYTGRLYFVCDNEDKTVDRYRANFGSERVIVFDKKAEADLCDEGNNFDERRTITMARNACFGIAERLGVRYFVELDDDYNNFWFELADAHKRSVPIKQINNTFANMIKFYKSTKCLSIAFAQSGDFIGGLDNGKGLYRFNKRKCMNSFLCSTKRPFRFIGAMNEDVNTYTTAGSRGGLFLTIPFVSVNQTASQSQKGGITDMYLRYGTYCKAFTTAMMMPSSVKVSMMNSSNPRLHHSIDWQRTAPCILRESVKRNHVIVDEYRTEERAAIYEYDAGLSRDDADRMAQIPESTIPASKGGAE